MYWNAQYFTAQYYSVDYWRDSGVVPPTPPAPPVPVVVFGGGIAKRRRKPALVPNALWEFVLEYLTARERAAWIARVKRDDEEITGIL